MSQRRFFFQLFLLTASVAFLLAVLQWVTAFQPYCNFLFISLLFFVVLNLLTYLLAAKAAVSKDKNAFTRLIMLAMFVKMALTAILVILYHLWYQPEGDIYLLPFFGIYVIFTIFETAFMTRLGKIKAH